MIDINKIKSVEMFAGFTAKFIHTENLTLGFWEVKKDAVLPEHSHINEQVTQVLEGELELTIDGKTAIYRAGCLVVIPPNLTHGGKAITDCKLFDVFHPSREDYKM
jgi:quercetin dioxygenase-like cupin family protein